MYRGLVFAILAVAGTFLVLTVVIVAGKASREMREAWRRARRRELEPRILEYAHGEHASILLALGGPVSRRDRPVVEEVLLDHAQRVKGIERERLCRALEELGFVAEYLGALRSRRWWRRTEAAERLGLSGARRAVPELARALEDEVSEVRLRAAKALGALGGVAAIRPLIAALEEPNRWSTIRIADILAEMGADVAHELIRAFPELELHAKVAAIDILGRVRSLQAAEWLRLRLRSFEPDVRARACHALGLIGDVAAGPALVEALRDSEWAVRAMAAKALGRIRFRQAIPELCATLRDAEWWVRANAAEALGEMGEEGIAALKRMLRDEDRFARDQAVRMLEERGVLDQEAARLSDPDPERRGRAQELMEAVVRVGRTARLAELAERHPDASVCAALRELLAAAANTEGAPEAAP